MIQVWPEDACNNLLHYPQLLHWPDQDPPQFPEAQSRLLWSIARLAEQSHTSLCFTVDVGQLRQADTDALWQQRSLASVAELLKHKGSSQLASINLLVAEQAASRLATDLQAKQLASIVQVHKVDSSAEVPVNELHRVLTTASEKGQATVLWVQGSAAWSLGTAQQLMPSIDFLVIHSSASEAMAAQLQPWEQTHTLLSISAEILTPLNRSCWQQPSVKNHLQARSGLWLMARHKWASSLSTLYDRRPRLQRRWPPPAAVTTWLSHQQMPINTAALMSIRRHCHQLDSRIYAECLPWASDTWLAQHQPWSRRAFVTEIRQGFIADARVHEAVPGTVFTQDSFFRWQPYVRTVPPGHPLSWQPAAKVIAEHSCLASILQAYPGEKGHFAHESLPRLLLLAAHTPAHCRILYVSNSFVDRYIALLPADVKARMLSWKGPGYVYTAKSVFVTNEVPYIITRNTHIGGMSTFFLPELVSRVRQVFRPANHADANQHQRVVVIRRGPGGAREYVHHDALVAHLRQRLGQASVTVFDASGSLQDHINIFATAKIVVGPHGAGFANLVFCQPQTRVVEIGWPGKAIGWQGPSGSDNGAFAMDNMYWRLSDALGLDYRLILAESGDYYSRLGGSLSKVIAAVLEQ